MLKTRLTGLAAAALYALPIAWAAPQPPPRAAELAPKLASKLVTALAYPSKIRVRLDEAAPRALVRATGLKLGGANRVPAAVGEGVWELRCQDGRVRAFSGARTIELKEPAIVEAVAGAPVLYNDRPYRERLEVHSAGSFCEVVNHVEIESYLAGLVNSEFSSKWNGEAIGAQVVAARTYAIHQIMLARPMLERHYDVDSTVRDQVYDGYLKEDARALELVQKTRGWVLTAGPGAGTPPLKAFYHSTCGGITELPEQVWGGAHAGFRRAVKCPYCASSPVMSWQIELSAREVADAFARAQRSGDAAGAAQAGRWPAQWREVLARGYLRDVRAGRVNAEGRVSEILTYWSGPRGESVELRVSGVRWRDWLGVGRVRSVAFEVVGYGGGRWRLQGRGNGHGVGMCQWGAKTMGERGFNTASILKFYYPDAGLRKLW